MTLPAVLSQLALYRLRLFSVLLESMPASSTISHSNPAVDRLSFSGGAPWGSSTAGFFDRP
jgi:hypothetical protein